MDKLMRDSSFLKKIVQEIDYLLGLMGNETLETFVENEERKRAASMTFLNIGELASKLSEDFQKRNVDIPIRKIINLRHRGRAWISRA